LLVRCQLSVLSVFAVMLVMPLSSHAQASSSQPATQAIPSAAAPSTTKADPPKRQAKGNKGKKKKIKEEPPPQPVVQAPPPPPPTPEQLPATPPNVKYLNGQLTILAQNSTLGDILHEVRAKTGAVIDIPPGANERVVGQIGPGPARDVLASLLNGSHFNYVMVASSNSPDSVAEVILTAKSGTPASNAPVAYQPPPQPTYPNGVQQPQFIQQPPPDPTGQAEAPVEEQPQVEGVEEQDTSQDNAADQGAPEQVEGQGQQGPAQVKTPEQLLQELQRQQQLMQQQQQQQQQQGQPGQSPVAIPQTPPDQQQDQPPPDE